MTNTTNQDQDISTSEINDFITLNNAQLGALWDAISQLENRINTVLTSTDDWPMENFPSSAETDTGRSLEENTHMLVAMTERLRKITSRVRI